MANPKEVQEQAPKQMRVPAEYESLVETFPKVVGMATLSLIQQQVVDDPRSTVHQAECAPEVINYELQD